MGESVYEIVCIARGGGNLANDEERVGKRVIPRLYSVGYCGIFDYEGTEKALQTSRITSIDKTDNEMIVRTSNTAYKLRVVSSH
jgi:hypothetical protein